MALVIEDRDLNAAHITEEELRLEIAILLYQQERFSMGQSKSRFAEMNRILFQRELGKRDTQIMTLKTRKRIWKPLE